ncbi:flagellar biosynthetic protein FliP [Marinicauda salina]|uniref:Flagellar biosynthetic protein FliP n=1 Tax=Marinicauda salina TaxID=2135793 RepID=A0A2U2BU48_9PROT|nr:flagellar type III secretion system pore protein FliP [Marinicauda salina]PWE17546.1 flagellar biosynthetic protein FliP [Marinicauda salina]
MSRRAWLHAIGVLVAAAAATVFFAAPGLAQELSIDLGSEGSLTERVLQLVALLTVLSLAPSILIMTTSFVRIVVVLSLLRTAIGLQQSPPNTVLVSLALFLTAFIMAPVFTQSYQEGIRPLLNGEIETSEAFQRSAQPVKMFMLDHTREDDLSLFFDIANIEPETPEATPVHVVAPAFMISELRRAFEIGFLLFIPFLIIDLVVASILMSMGMMMLPPIIISLPFKLIFFVLIDGWRLVAGSLVQSFQAGGGG